VDAEEQDRKVAEELALEVRSASGGPRTWRRVATLLEAFGVTSLSPDIRERIASALADARIEVHPPLQRVTGDEIVRLSLPDSDALWMDAASDARADAARARPPISGTEWHPGGRLVELDLQEPATEGLTVWFDVDPLLATTRHVLDELWPFCSGLTPDMVDDLLSPGPRTSVRSYGSDGRIRLVTLFNVDVRERKDEPQRPTKAGELVLQTVTLLAGDGWLLSCWHRPEAYGAGTRWDVESDGAPFGRAVAAVQRRLKGSSTAPTSGDLGINVVYSLACRYSASARRLAAWLEAWELDFHRHLEGSAGGRLAGLEKSTLVDLRGLLAEFRGRLHALDQRGLDPADAWFTGVQDGERAGRVSELLTTCLADLRDLDDSLRTSLELLASSSAAEQAEASARAAAQGERLNRQVALITSVLLVPTFLAEVSGTNVFPGKEGWLEFALLVALMVLLGVLTYRFLSRRHVAGGGEAAR
jgi:hypothetical protein